MRRVTLLFFVLALLLLFPSWWGAGLGPTVAALGHPRADTWNHVWGYDHVAHSIIDGSLPWRTSEKQWPQGGALWFIDLPLAVLLAPITLLIGPVFAYNLGILLNLCFAGVAMYALARRVGAQPTGAGLAGLAFCVQPHLLGQIFNGISETLSVGWLPLSAWALYGLREAPCRWNGVLAGGIIGLSVWFNPYYGLLCAGMAVVFGLSALAVPARLRRGWLDWVLAAGLAAGLAAAFGMLFSASLDAEDALVSRDPVFVYQTLVGHNMVDVLSFFIPGNFHSPDLKALFDEDMVVVVYLGWALLFLAGAGYWRGRAWAVGAVGVWVLALGPFLYLGGNYVQLGENNYVPLPFLALYDLVPAVSRISHPYRFVILVNLCLSVLAGLGLRRLPMAWHTRAALGGALIILVEVLGLSPAPWPLPVADARPSLASVRLSEDPRPGAVLDLPVTQAVLDRSHYDWEQRLHHRAIPYGLNDPSPEYLMQNPLTEAIISLERSPVRSLPPRLPSLDLEIGRRRLVADGLGFIVVHTDRYPAGQVQKVLDLLNPLLGAGEQAGAAWIFALNPPGG